MRAKQKIEKKIKKVLMSIRTGLIKLLNIILWVDGRKLKERKVLLFKSGEPAVLEEDDKVSTWSSLSDVKVSSNQLLVFGTLYLITFIVSLHLDITALTVLCQSEIAVGSSFLLASRVVRWAVNFCIEPLISLIMKLLHKALFTNDS